MKLIDFEELEAEIENQISLWDQLLKVLPCEVSTLGRPTLYRAEYLDGDIRFEHLETDKKWSPLKVTKAMVDDIDAQVWVGREIKVGATKGEPDSRTLDWYCKQHTRTMVSHVLAPLLVEAGWKVTKIRPVHITRQ